MQKVGGHIFVPNNLDFTGCHPGHRHYVSRSWVDLGCAECLPPAIPLRDYNLPIHSTGHLARHHKSFVRMIFALAVSSGDLSQMGNHVYTTYFEIRRLFRDVASVLVWRGEFVSVTSLELLAG